MKSEEELKKARGRLTEAEMATIRSLKGTLEMFEKDPSITMIKMREMQNFYNTVRVLKDGYIEKIINLLKEGTKLDQLGYLYFSALQLSRTSEEVSALSYTRTCPIAPSK